MQTAEQFFSELLSMLAEPPKRRVSPPMKIAMMTHFYGVIGPFTPEPARTSPAYTKFVKQLLAEGLIERPSKEDREKFPGWAYRATPKGNVYVEALCGVPLPVPASPDKQWVMPK